MKTFKFIGLFITITIFISCATSIPISLLCNEQHIEIYVDEEYVGRGQVNYIVPKGTDYIKVSCRENGVSAPYLCARKEEKVRLSLAFVFRVERVVES